LLAFDEKLFAEDPAAASVLAALRAQSGEKPATSPKNSSARTTPDICLCF
jgi:hypothetical protein